MRRDRREDLRDRTHIPVDRPLIVVQHHDQLLRVRRHIVQRLKHRPARERRITRHTHHMLIRPLQIPRRRHPQRRRKRRPRMTRPVAVMLTLRPQQKPVQPLILPNRVNPVPPPRQHLVHIPLVRHIKHKLVLRRVKHPVHRQRQLHHPKVRPKMSPGLAQRLDQRLPNLFRKCRQLLHRERLNVRRGSNV